MISEKEECQKFLQIINILEKQEMTVVILPEKKMIIAPMTIESLRRFTVRFIHQMILIVIPPQVRAVITQVKIYFSQVLIEAEVDMKTTIADGILDREEMNVDIEMIIIEGEMTGKELKKDLMTGSIVRRRMKDIIRFMTTRSIETLTREGKNMNMRRERIIEKIIPLSESRKRNTKDCPRRENLRKEGKKEKRRGGTKGDNILERMRDGMTVDRKNMRKAMSLRRESILKRENTEESKVRETQGINIKRENM